LDRSAVLLGGSGGIHCSTLSTFEQTSLLNATSDARMRDVGVAGTDRWTPSIGGKIMRMPTAVVAHCGHAR
jgi:hypothetical protein